MPKGVTATSSMGTLLPPAGGDGTAVEQQGYRAGDRDSLVGYVAEDCVDHDDVLTVEGH